MNATFRALLLLGSFCCATAALPPAPPAQGAGPSTPLGLPASAEAGHASGIISPAASNVVERGRYHKVIESVRRAPGGSGQVLKTNRYTVLQNGMNRTNASGEWVECQPVIEQRLDTILCTGASYRVMLATNINVGGAVDLETSDGERIMSHPAGIGLFDPESGRSVLLAEVKDCQAAIISNRVVYADAFEGSGIKAAVAYRYGVGRFHQDVIFTRRPPITPANYGMSSRARLEVLTEIDDG